MSFAASSRATCETFHGALRSKIPWWQNFRWSFSLACNQTDFLVSFFKMKNNSGLGTFVSNRHLIMVRNAISLRAIILFGLLSLAHQVCADTMTLKPVADTSLFQFKPDN